jgi:hypothetical protein
MPALTDRLRFVQETDESAYSVLLMHLGIPLESAPEVKPCDRLLMVLRRMEWRRMLSSEYLYLEPTTDGYCSFRYTGQHGDHNGPAM